MAADQSTGGDLLRRLQRRQDVFQRSQYLNGKIFFVRERDPGIATAAAQFLFVPGLRVLLRMGSGWVGRVVGFERGGRRGDDQLELRAFGLDVIIGQPGFPLGIGELAQVIVAQPDDNGKVAVTDEEVIDRVLAGCAAVLAGLVADEMNDRVALGDVVIELHQDGAAGGKLRDVCFLVLGDDIREAQILGESLATRQELIRNGRDEEATRRHRKSGGDRAWFIAQK